MSPFTISSLQHSSVLSCLPVRRGDFAAGKMLGDGTPERGEILIDDIKQCVIDIDSKIAKLAEGPPLRPGAAPDALAAVCA